MQQTDRFLFTLSPRRKIFERSGASHTQTHTHIYTHKENNRGKKGSMFFIPFLTRYSRHFHTKFHYSPSIRITQVAGECTLIPAGNTSSWYFGTFIIDVLPEDPLRAKERRLAGRRKKHSERESRARFFAFQLTTLLPGLNKPCRRGHVHVHTGHRDLRRESRKFMCKRCHSMLSYWRVAFDSFWRGICMSSEKPGDGSSIRKGFRG